MIGKIKGMGGVGGSNLNVFAQLAEPKVKDGIWIKTETTIINVESKYNTNIPYPFNDGSAVAIGTNIYLFGGFDYETYVYKYDTLTDTYTQLKNIPYQFRGGNAVAIGNDIYLLGSSYTNRCKNAYKYNILTNTYTQLAIIPYNFYNGDVVAVRHRYLFIRR